MAGNNDWLPSNWEEFTVWHENWADKLPTVAGKYNVSGAYLGQLSKDDGWLQYWVSAKMAVRQQEKQLTEYMDDIAKMPVGSPAPLEPTLALPPNSPGGIPVGLRARIREAANLIKDQKSVYTVADGELLGIVGVETEEPVNPVPSFEIKTLQNFNLRAEYQKKGYTAIRFEYRHKGGAWQFGGIFTSSPGDFSVAPQTAGEAEQVEVRAIYLEKNQPIGDYSDIKVVLIAP